jgi:H+-transporting ATPase
MTNEPKPDATTVEPKPAAKVDPKPKATGELPFDLTPQIVKRVHELYEELGREDVRAVQDWEKAERETRKAEVKAEPKPNK